MVEQNPSTHMLHGFHPNTSSWSVFNKYHEAPFQHAVSRLTNKELGTWLVLMHLYCLPVNHSSSISEIFNLHSVSLFLQIFDVFTLLLLKTASLLVNQTQENFFHVCYFKIIEPTAVPVVHVNPIATADATSVVVKDRSMSLLCTT